MGRFSRLKVPSISENEMHENGWISVRTLSMKSGFTKEAIYHWISRRMIEARKLSTNSIIVVKEIPLPPKEIKWINRSKDC